MPSKMGLQSVERQAVTSICMAFPGVVLGGTGTPILRRTSSMRSRMTKTFWPAMVLSPAGNCEVMMTRMAARVPADAVGATAEGDAAGVIGATEAGDAGAGEAGALETARVAGDGGSEAAAIEVPVLLFLGWKAPTSQVAAVVV